MGQFAAHSTAHTWRSEEFAAHSMARMWRSEGSFQEAVFSSCHVGSGLVWVTRAFTVSHLISRAQVLVLYLDVTKDLDIQHPIMQLERRSIFKFLYFLLHLPPLRRVS